MKAAFLAALALAAGSSLEAQTTAQSQSVDLTSVTPSPGTWSYARGADGSEATFRNASALPQLTIRCTHSARRVTISRPASAAAPSLFVWTSSMARNVPARFDPATGTASADLAAFDATLDAISFSRGRFGVSVSGAPPFVVPAWAEPVRVIEDCRT